MIETNHRVPRGIPFLLTLSAFLPKQIGLLPLTVFCRVLPSSFPGCHAVTAAGSGSNTGADHPFDGALQVRKLLLLAFIVLGIVALPGPASAASTCYAVTASGAGSKNGSSWSNAYAGIPATLTRGAIYYLADGTYGSFTFSTAAAGSTMIEIRKAQAYDYGAGTNCTSSIGAGWNASTMGSAQAVFTPLFEVNKPYFIINGNGQQTAPGCGGAPGSTVSASLPTPTDCGIKISDTTGGGVIGMLGAGNYTFEYVEWLADSNPADNEDLFFNGVGDTGYSTFSHIYAHNAGCVYIQGGNGNRTISYSYFWGTEVQGTLQDGCHGQAEFEWGGTSNVVIDNNVYRDITGTAIWTIAAGGGTATNWQIYNNVVWNSSPRASWSPYTSDGALACINANTNCTNFTMVQNTFVNLTNSGINNENTGSYTVQNNLWYSNTVSTNFNVGTGGTYTQGYNTFLQTIGGSSGTANVTVTSSIPNPFVSWTTGNFNLASENSDWNNRVALGSSYNTDAAGNTFTSDRGAYQYAQSSPQPPSNLQAAPH